MIWSQLSLTSFGRRSPPCVWRSTCARSKSRGRLQVRRANRCVAAENTTDALQAMVDDILDLSRIESGKIELYPLPTRVADLIEKAIEANKAEASAKGLHLTVDFPVPEVKVL